MIRTKIKISGFGNEPFIFITLPQLPSKGDHIYLCDEDIEKFKYAVRISLPNHEVWNKQYNDLPDYVWKSNNIVDHVEYWSGEDKPAVILSLNKKEYERCKNNL